MKTAEKVRMPTILVASLRVKGEDDILQHTTPVVKEAKIYVICVHYGV